MRGTRGSPKRCNRLMAGMQEGLANSAKTERDCCRRFAFLRDGASLPRSRGRRVLSPLVAPVAESMEVYQQIFGSRGSGSHSSNVRSTCCLCRMTHKAFLSDCAENHQVLIRKGGPTLAKRWGEKNSPRVALPLRSVAPLFDGLVRLPDPPQSGSMDAVKVIRPGFAASLRMVILLRTTMRPSTTCRGAIWRSSFGPVPQGAQRWDQGKPTPCDQAGGANHSTSACGLRRHHHAANLTRQWFHKIFTVTTPSGVTVPAHHNAHAAPSDRRRSMASSMESLASSSKADASNPPWPDQDRTEPAPYSTRPPDAHRCQPPTRGNDFACERRLDSGSKDRRWWSPAPMAPCGFEPGAREGQKFDRSVQCVDHQDLPVVPSLRGEQCDRAFSVRPDRFPRGGRPGLHGLDEGQQQDHRRGPAEDRQRGGQGVHQSVGMTAEDFFGQ